MKYNLKHGMLAFILILIYLTPNLRTIAKHAPVYPIIFLVAQAVFTACILYFYQSKAIQRYLRSFQLNITIIFIVLLFLSLFIFYVYPIADGLKLLNRGSDQDDCVIIGVNRLLEMSNPYYEKSYFGNPCSTGMGMLILYTPFVLLGIYEYGTIIIAFVTFLILIRSCDRLCVSSFTIIFSFAAIFQIEMLVIGSDLYMIGFCLLMIASETVIVLKRRDTIKLIILSILVGLVASTRINFIILIPLLVMFSGIHWKGGALLLGFVSSGIALIPSLFIYFESPENFTPFHLLSKSDGLLGHGFKELAILVTIIGLLTSMRLIKNSVFNVPIGITITILPSLLLLSLGDLINRSGDFSAWEGANYLLPLIPLIAFLLCQKYPKR